MSLWYYHAKLWIRAIVNRRISERAWIVECRRIALRKWKWKETPGIDGYFDALCEGYRNEGYTPLEALEEDCSYGD